MSALYVATPGANHTAHLTRWALSLGDERMANQLHHADPRFTRAARLVRAAANGNPRAICWRCGKTIAQHEAKPSRRWSGGHTIDGVNGPPWLDVERRPPVGRVAWIAPEVLSCNIKSGNLARHLNADTGYH